MLLLLEGVLASYLCHLALVKFEHDRAAGNVKAELAEGAVIVFPATMRTLEIFRAKNLYRFSQIFVATFYLDECGELLDYDGHGW
jgi:hypothetical protein